MTRGESPQSLAERILDFVQEVDRGYDFAGRDRAEGYFSDCLRNAIVSGGGTATREVAYLDNPRLHCDLFMELAGNRCYLEVKLLFPTYWSKTRNWIARDRQRLLAPLEAFTIGQESHSVARDLEKLATHCLDGPDYLGILVVSSHDAEYKTDPDFAKLATLGRLDQPPWFSASRQFPNTFWYAKGGYHLDARIWLCPGDQITGWWESVKHLYQT